VNGADWGRAGVTGVGVGRADMTFFLPDSEL
jgi:hypothetical protein